MSGYMVSGSAREIASVNPDTYNDPAVLRALQSEAMHARTKVNEEISILKTEETSVVSSNSDADLYVDLGAKVMGLDLIKTSLDIYDDRTQELDTQSFGQVVTKKKEPDKLEENVKLPERCELAGFSLRAQKQERLGLVGDENAAENLKDVEGAKQKIAGVELGKQLIYGKVMENDKALASLEVALAKHHAPQVPGLTFDLMGGPKFNASILKEPVDTSSTASA